VALGLLHFTLSDPTDMDAPAFLKTAIDPEQWLTKSAALRRAGNRLWESFFENWLRSGLRHRSYRVDEAKMFFGHAMDYLTSAKFMYGYSVETAFKAHLLRHSPGEIEFKLGADGTGEVRSAELKQFGTQMGASHNLEQLGQRTGVLTLEGNPIFQHQSDVNAVREILRELSEIVYWSGRYPVPLKSGETFQPTGEVPSAAFAHYMRDWLDPVLDHFQGVHAPPNDFDESTRRVQAIIDSENAPSRPDTR
jgi:hypothetical protein